MGSWSPESDWLSVMNAEAQVDFWHKDLKAIISELRWLQELSEEYPTLNLDDEIIETKEDMKESREGLRKAKEKLKKTMKRVEGSNTL